LSIPIKAYKLGLFKDISKFQCFMFYQNNTADTVTDTSLNAVIYTYFRK